MRTLLKPLLAQDPRFVSFYAPIFQSLTGKNLLKLGQQVHAQMALRGFEPDAYLGAKMVAMYASSDDLDSAVAIFHRVNNPSTLLYNSIIRAYTLHGFSEETMEIYGRMHCLGLKADNFTYPFVLKCCAELSRIWIGKCVHGLSLKVGLESDMYVGTSLINMYVKCCDMSDARRLFDKMTVRDVSSWNALIAGYMKDGEICLAEDLFGKMPGRNIVSWTAMISGYTQNGLAEQALFLFDEMLKKDSKVKPNWVTIMSVLPACAHSAALERGRKIHNFASRIGLESNVSIQTALLAMYAKCGSLLDARQCFERVRGTQNNLVAWNTMITAYASHGRGSEAVSTFEDMIVAGVQPDNITFTGLLSGCSHSGLVDVGLKYFDYMKRVYSVEPGVEHYACVVDLLGRAGRLAEAKDLISKMPMQAGPSIWGAMLSACRKHHNLEIAEIAARSLFILEPENSGNYVMLSNIYAEAGMWKEVDNLRVLLKAQGVKKNPGCSWTE
ncbi:hypothetical protein DVH24_023876 [Malus domestica]|uniref:Pentacotripeptide-repeat region of PRORP domain-containing protein n=1 Tax=Malus domestica TaxID=3750 RepID=A0A498JKN8_MALDO|nr:hypothetical protein DVH24_023876 [Malus domestica]